MVDPVQREMEQQSPQRDPAGSHPAVRPEQLPSLDLEDYVPSIRPWLRVCSTAMLASVVLGVGFMAVCPYRVVVRGEGSMRPAGDQVVVNAPFAGRVVDVAVAINQSVQTGQTILTLDPSQLQGAAVQLGRSRSALADQESALRLESESEDEKARLEVRKSQAALALARSELNRYSALAREGAATQSDYEAKLAVFNQSQATLQQARESLESVRSSARQRQAELLREKAGVDQSSAETRRNLSSTAVRAPVKGVVFQMLVRSLQQTVAPGEQLAIITPSAAERLAKVSVSSEDVDTLRRGQFADLRVVGCPYPDFGTLAAKVVAVSPDALPDSDRYEVTLKPQKTILTSRTRRCEVKIGMPLQADIRTREETILQFVLRKVRIWIEA
jgi:multidrug resistance efflux pump